jgi:hypothetical protein
MLPILSYSPTSDLRILMPLQYALGEVIIFFTSDKPCYVNFLGLDFARVAAIGLRNPADLLPEPAPRRLH